MTQKAAASTANNLNTPANARAAGAGIKLGALFAASQQANKTADLNRAAAAQRIAINRQLGKMSADEVRRASSAELANAVANAQGVKINTGTPLNALVEFARRSELQALMEEFSFEVQSTDIANRASINAFTMKSKAKQALGAGVIDTAFTFGEIGRSQPVSTPTKKAGKPLPSRSPAIKRTASGTIIGGV